jgi:hypothetical protein
MIYRVDPKHPGDWKNCYMHPHLYKDLFGRVPLVYLLRGMLERLGFRNSRQ